MAMRMNGEGCWTIEQVSPRSRRMTPLSVKPLDPVIHERDTPEHEMLYLLL